MLPLFGSTVKLDRLHSGTYQNVSLFPIMSLLISFPILYVSFLFFRMKKSVRNVVTPKVSFTQPSSQHGPEDSIDEIDLKEANESHCNSKTKNFDCDNIDDAMMALSSFRFDNYEQQTFHEQGIAFDHPYDWLLDGDPKEITESTFTNMNSSHHSLTLELNPSQSLELEMEMEDSYTGLELEPQCQAINVIENTVSIDAKEVYVKPQEDIEPEERIIDESRKESLESNSIDADPKSFYSFQKDDKWMDTWNGIPDFLPHQDTTTPEGQFILKCQIDRDKSDVALEEVDDEKDQYIKELTDEYCDSENTILEMLQSMPWEDFDEHKNEEHDLVSESAMQQNAYLIEKMSTLDELHQTVTATLLQKVKFKEEEIALEMKRAQAVDHDVTSALSYAKQAITYVQRTKGRDEGLGVSRDGVLGGLYILEESNKRDLLLQLQAVMMKIQEVAEMEASVFDFVHNFTTNLLQDANGLDNVLKTCENLKNKLLRDDVYLRLECLDESRERVSQIMNYLCQKVEEELMTFLFQRCNGEFEYKWDERIHNKYNTLLEARITFDDMKIEETKMTSDDDSSQEEKEDLPDDLASQWAYSIHKALCFEAERCLTKALLDPTPLYDCSQEDPSNFESNIAEIRENLLKIQCFGQDAASVRALTNNLFSIRLEFDERDPNIVGIFHKLCYSLCEVLNSYQKLLQWHINCCTCKIEGENNISAADEESESCSLVATCDDLDCTKDDHTKSTSASNCSRTSSPIQHLRKHSDSDTDIPRIPHSISGPQDNNVSDDQEKFEELSISISSNKRALWLHCKSILVHFLETIFTSTEDKEEEDWSLTWRQDLESLSDIYKLCEQFLTIGRSFVEVGDLDLARSFLSESKNECDLRKSFGRLCERYISGAHEEAMTEIGTMMASETWDLLPIDFVENGDDEDSHSQVIKSINKFLLGVQQSTCTLVARENCRQAWYNKFNSQPTKTLESFFEEGQNPFGLVEIDGAKEKSENLTSLDLTLTLDGIIDERKTLFDKVLSYSSKSEIVLATKTALNGLARWSIRLLDINTKLPIVTSQIVTVICNLYDLYFLTVFRLCSGTGGNESILLGTNKRSDHILIDRFPRDIPPPQSGFRNFNRSNSFGMPRNSSNSQLDPVLKRFMNMLVTKYCVADINAPHLSEEDGIAKANRFITRGQASLASWISLEQVESWVLCHDDLSRRDENLYTAKCMEKLFAASSSCLFVTCLLEACIFKMNSGSVTKKNSPIIKYYKHLIGAINTIHLKSMQICGSRAIMSRKTVANVSYSLVYFLLLYLNFSLPSFQKIVALGDVWAGSKIKEHCNTYIDQLSDRYLTLWDHLSTSSLAASEGILHDVWKHVLESGYLALLEGFAKVHNCSTEGRALMSIDLASFSSNINKRAITERFIETFGKKKDFVPPPPITNMRGMQYVDMYIKVFYFPQEDALKWIEENREEYHLAQLLSLVSNGAHNQMPSIKFQEMMSLRQKVKSA